MGLRSDGRRVLVCAVRSALNLDNDFLEGFQTVDMIERIESQGAKIGARVRANFAQSSLSRRKPAPPTDVLQHFRRTLPSRIVSIQLGAHAVAERGLRRLEAALSKVGPETLAPILRSLGLIRSIISTVWNPQESRCRD